MREEILIRTEEVSVTVLELTEGEEIGWHHHTEITDNLICLEGLFRVNLRGPDETHELSPGQRCQVVPGRSHRVTNLSDGVGRYLVVQGVGKYDRIMA